MTGSTSRSRWPCIALVGPTAVGKSAAAYAVARHLPCEIISMDSAQVYIGMDIGTAKPSADERSAVPHHLIDIRDPTEAFSAALFAEHAGRLVPAIRARGRVPLIVGGTLLYLRALVQGLDAMPAAHAQVRRELEAQALLQGWPALHAELARVDPVTAARLAPADGQRIQRALEVWRTSGRPISSFQSGQRAGDAAAEPARGVVDLVVSLEPLDRDWLRTRIAQRFDAMLANGLVDEVQRLRRRGDLHGDLPSMRCVGYRQVWDTLEGTRSAADLRDRGIFATRQLAKRQLTWLRAMAGRQQVAADGADPVGRVVELCLRSAEGQDADAPV